MFTNKLMPLVAMLALLMFSASCKKEEKGCTDPDATNLCTTCDSDDGSCEYSGNLVFWYGQSASTEITGDGVVSLTYYLDGQVVGSQAASVFFVSAPDCDNGAATVITRNLGSNKSKTFVYRVADQSGTTLWEGNVNITANNCLALELAGSGTSDPRAKFLGTYSVTDDCISSSGSCDDSYTYSMIISEGSSANSVIIQNFGDYFTSINATVSGNNIVFQTYTGIEGANSDFYDINSGSGTYNNGILTFDFQYDDILYDNFCGDIDCQSVGTKQ